MNAWKKAASVAELGNLMSDWLEGRISTSPTCVDDSGPDEETKHLIPVLASLCRTGIVTTDSQPGNVEMDCGRRWEQRAIRELRRSTYLILIDPVWGRDDRLWPALANAIR